MATENESFADDRPKVHCEASLVSWLVSRPSTMSASAVRQAYTRNWREKRAGECDLYVSGFVVREAADGDRERADLRIVDHIATTAVYGMDGLLTWNCKHMANLVTLPKTASVSAKVGYECPKILTPKDALEV